MTFGRSHLAALLVAMLALMKFSYVAVLDLAGYPPLLTFDNEQRCLHFVDERLGFFLGRKWEIYKTVDGGDTWTEIVSLKVIDESERFHTIFFASPTRGWVLGKSVYLTNDGAVTWKRLNTTPIGDHTRTEKPRVCDCGLSRILEPVVMEFEFTP